MQDRTDMAGRAHGVRGGERTGHHGASPARHNGPAPRDNIAWALSRSSALGLRRSALRQSLPALLVLGMVVLLWDKVAQLDLAFIRTALATLAPWQWLAACGFTAISFWALGRYDRVVHRLLQTSAPPKHAERAGIAAIAISQTVGMGVISSTFVRWRMLPDISLTQAARISALVSASFLSAWAVILSTAIILVPMSFPWGGWGRAVAGTILAVAALALLVSVLRPGPVAGLRLPPLRAVGAFLGLAMLDMTAAGAVLWVLLPDGCDVPFPVLLPAYILALGAGLISGTPGGMGGFEITLLAALPDIGHEPLLAAILAFRAVYYALPAGLAAVLTIRGPGARPAQGSGQGGARLRAVPGPHLPVPVTRALHTAARAETGLLRHGRLSLIENGGGTPIAMGAACGQSLIVVSDPIDPTRAPDRSLAEIKALAHEGFRSAFLYKIGGRTACAARRAGWHVLPIAREASLNPQRFTLDGSEKRQLRRKLRKADGAGVVVQRGGTNLPLTGMGQIASHWSRSHGGERGFSMGVWAPANLPFARVYLAFRHGQLVGFVTLHANANEHTLDLMRVDPTAPDGTMHALVTAAIAAAKAEGISRFSLAAVPLGTSLQEPPIHRNLRKLIDTASGAGGLRQFKATFAPQWETLYAAAPGVVALGVGVLEVTREIHRPVPKRPA